jgi:polysaccharide lyase-like protein
LTARIALLAVPVAALVAALVALETPEPDGSAGVDARAGLERGASTALTASLETGDFREFSQSEASRGSLTVTGQRAYDGSHAAAARYRGGPGNGYARAIQNVSLRDGQDVWYGAAFYLPMGFKRAMQGEVALLRWDNYLARGTAGDVGGVVVWGSDRRARLVLSRYGGHERILVGPFDVPEGLWFSLLVHQRLAKPSGRALNEVYVDGLLTGSSRAGNTAGRKIQRVRYGLVALNAGAQRDPLTLWFDRCIVTSRRRPAPAGASERAWATAPEIEERPR